MAKAKGNEVSHGLEKDVDALARHGIRFTIRNGEVYIDVRDWKKYDKLCDEGKLPPSVC